MPVIQIETICPKTQKVRFREPQNRHKFKSVHRQKFQSNFFF